MAGSRALGAAAQALVLAAALCTTGCLAAQDAGAGAAFEAYLACRAAQGDAESPAEMRACWAPESGMANLPDDVLLDLLAQDPAPLSDPTLVGGVEADPGIELHIRGSLDGAPAAERVRMRREGDAWLVVDARTRVYPEALTAVDGERPLRFALTVDGERALDESTAVLSVADVGFPSLVLHPWFDEEPTLQIDNLRLGTASQTVARRPSNVLRDDPGLISAALRAGEIPLDHDLTGELDMTVAEAGTASGRVRLLLSGATLAAPVEVVFEFENLPLSP